MEVLLSAEAGSRLETRIANAGDRGKRGVRRARSYLVASACVLWGKGAFWSRPESSLPANRAGQARSTSQAFAEASTCS